MLENMAANADKLVEILPQLGICYGGIFVVIGVIWVGIAVMAKLFKK